MPELWGIFVCHFQNAAVFVIWLGVPWTGTWYNNLWAFLGVLTGCIWTFYGFWQVIYNLSQFCNFSYFLLPDRLQDHDLVHVRPRKWLDGLFPMLTYFVQNFVRICVCHFQNTVVLVTTSVIFWFFRPLAVPWIGTWCQSHVTRNL